MFKMSLPRKPLRFKEALVALGCVASCSAQTLSTFKFPEGATPAAFQGFATHGPGTVATYSCDSGSTHATHSASSFAGCCAPNEECEFFTRCNAGTATRIDGSTYRCSGTLPNCYTMTIYQSFPFAADHWLKIGCVQPDFDAHTIYREIVPTAAITGSGTTTSGTAPFASKTGDPDAQESVAASASPESKAWIAGAVIGPVFAVVVALFVIFWRRKRSRGRSEGEGTETGEKVGSADKHELQSISPLRLEESPSRAVAPAELPNYSRWELDSFSAAEVPGLETRRK
ncbi:hypothetical protein B0T14DRAFT_518254 [Immersiella caudata]|uniref:Uncharacterized protein n=1 Tax=Immersiella caudata TaxID=314043 RepID=A0AA39WNY4_9PEZI|nr:hypothetical protein B0T14DRAFT_518254 [Immersiella caudata]